MANSSQSGNILGYASGTQPGLVSTVAQTFAGKKTLDGGALIKGDTSGSAIAAGYVGEVISATASAISVNTTNYVNICTVTLTAGIWNIAFICRAGGVASATLLQAGLATATGSNTGWAFGDTAGDVTVSSTANGSVCVSNIIKNISSSTQYWLTAAAAGATLTCAGRLTGIRIG